MPFIRFVRAQDVNAGEPYTPYVVNLDQVADITVGTNHGVHVLSFDAPGDVEIHDVFLAHGTSNSPAEIAAKESLLADLGRALSGGASILDKPFFTP